jgi:hypothetical protein
LEDLIRRPAVTTKANALDLLGAQARRILRDGIDRERYLNRILPARVGSGKLLA